MKITQLLGFREIVRALMESSFYFGMKTKERLELARRIFNGVS